MAETLLNCFAASEGLFLDVLEKTQMFFKKVKSGKEAVFGRSTWLVRRGQQERKERKNWR